MNQWHVVPHSTLLDVLRKGKHYVVVFISDNNVERVLSGITASPFAVVCLLGSASGPMKHKENNLLEVQASIELKQKLMIFENYRMKNLISKHLISSCFEMKDKLI